MAKKKKAEDELLAPDAFQESGKTWVSWLEKNAVLVFAGLGVVLLGVVGVEYARSQTARSASEVTTAFGEALNAYQEAADPTLASTATSTQVVDDKYAEAQEALAAFRASHASSPASRLALIYEADMAARRKAFEDAAKLYAEYLDAADEDDPLRFTAMEGAGYAYEQLEEYDQALAYFEMLAGVPFARPYALKHQARVLEAKGDTEAARARLEDLLASNPSTFLENFARNHLRLLN